MNFFSYRLSTHKTRSLSFDSISALLAEHHTISTLLCNFVHKVVMPWDGQEARECIKNRFINRAHIGTAVNDMICKMGAKWTTLNQVEPFLFVSALAIDL